YGSPFSCARSWAVLISGTGSRMVTVFKGTARLALPDFSARFMISVAASGWLSHHSASAASVRNVGIVIAFFGMLISLRSTSHLLLWLGHLIGRDDSDLAAPFGI